MAGRVLVFARAPEPGAAKTRLIPALGEEGAARLAEALLQHTLATVQGLPAALWCAPSTDHPAFARCRTVFGVRLHGQRGADLGERMHEAFRAALAEAPWALLIGTDCAGLRREDLFRAGAYLHAGADAVLGPAVDGGYYLIGLRRPRLALFTDIHWGSERVLAQTRARLREVGCRWQELAMRHDIDRPEDLQHVHRLVREASIRPRR